MSDAVIRAENLSKRYRIGEREQYGALRDVLARAVKAPLRMFKTQKAQSRNGDETHIWALKDVSFDVQQGEVVGIIGRNGAGKSTLLKILARVTKPTGGVADVRGRLGSLLEVGTGFHPELTGRENTFLNGAILGMTKREVGRKFDEIVAFAEIEKFIDTPVKHYSSGMYVRLAFAVAAHLDTEILLVDEVLAVGDAKFQRKCLGKIGEAASSGRTVLFVSHNMVPVSSLCTKAILLDHGTVATVGPTRKVVAAYIEDAEGNRAGEVSWNESDRIANNGRLRLIRARIVGPRGVSCDVVIDEPFTLEVEYEVMGTLNAASSVHVLDKHSALAFSTGTILRDSTPGAYRDSYQFPGNLLNDGLYAFNLLLMTDGFRIEVRVDRALTFTVHESSGREYLGDIGGAVRPHIDVVHTRLPAREGAA